MCGMVRPQMRGTQNQHLHSTWSTLRASVWNGQYTDEGDPEPASPLHVVHTEGQWSGQAADEGHTLPGLVTLPLISWVTLGRFRNFSLPQFISCKIEVNNSTSIPEKW